MSYSKDIVYRLKSGNPQPRSLHQDTIDEIETLRAANKELQAEVENLKAKQVELKTCMSDLIRVCAYSTAFINSKDIMPIPGQETLLIAFETAKAALKGASDGL